jgi:peptidyl-prolyl cis-trans isomerase B (cyclophilin B)
MKRLIALIALLTISSLVFVACGEDAPDPTATPASAPAASTGAGGQIDPNASMLSPGDVARPPAGALDTSKTYHATFKTGAGEFKILLFDDEAPLTVENFVNLATIGFYEGTQFHRVIPGFMAQGGDPKGTGAGGPGYRFRDEFDATKRHDKKGILSMANSGPNTNGSQFFITYDATPHLDDKHSVFGEVVEGMDNVFKITVRDPGTAAFTGDLIESITITES